MPEISIIVPVYKTKPYLKRCVDSILRQSFPAFELILVDDGSPDNAGILCDQYAQRDGRVHVIHQKNRGLAAARNAGIDWFFANSTSQWLTFVDSDDWIHPKTLEHLYRANAEHGTSISVCGYFNTKGADIPLDDVQPRLLKPEQLYLDHCSAASTAWGKLYRRECFARIRYPEGKLYEDEFVTYRLLFQQAHISFLDAPYYAYFTNPQGIMASSWSIRRLDQLEALEEQIHFFQSRSPAILEHRVNVFIFCCIHHFLRIIRYYHRRGKSGYLCSLLQKLSWALKLCVRYHIPLRILMAAYSHWLTDRLGRFVRR